MICLSSAAQVTYLLAVYTTRHISYVGIHRYILLISFMSPYRRHVILERGTFNSTPLDVVLSVSPNSRLMNFQHFRLLNNPEPDVPKGKPNGAVRSKLHHSKRLQFVLAAFFIDTRINRSIAKANTLCQYVLTRHKKQVNWVDLPILAV
uniref:Secreted protein n=2 Tax=Heterorhabditis bacteriophora TaxID=37862 RepID=A0A1I7WDN8_HETBA